MDIDAAAAHVAELYPALFAYLHRRIDPRSYQPSAEALAVLQHLAATGPLTVAEAARHFDRSQAAMSERIERMLKRGLLDRLCDRRDRRRHIVWLSSEGEQVLRNARSVLDPSRLRRALAAMSDHDRTDLVQGLQALRRAAEANLPQGVHQTAATPINE